MKNNETFRGLLTNDLNDARVILTGIPFDKNASIGKGASEAPDHIRELSIMMPPVTKDGYILKENAIFDNGNITTEDFGEMQEEALKILQTGKFPLFLGGDHSVAIATERAFFDHVKNLGKTPVIIHIDAHPDICDIYEDNYYSHATPNRRSLDYGYDVKNITLIGIRGIEVQEAEFFKQNPTLDVFKASDIRMLGTEKLVNYLAKKYSNNCMVYLSYDIDANDPSYAPGTGTPEPFGLTNFEVLDIIVGLFRKLNIAAMDIVEVSPKLDCNDITSYLAIKTIYEILYELQNK